ncbi:hypothetical protein CGRA01v4_05803 [Colletotrichum graminicola]|nr:hypothetical protein CGRA01v4_05803 [Colletotrichum graminicola]
MYPVKALSKVPSPGRLPWEVRKMLLPTNLPPDNAMYVHCILDTISTMDKLACDWQDQAMCVARPACSRLSVARRDGNCTVTSICSAPGASRA